MKFTTGKLLGEKGSHLLSITRGSQTLRAQERTTRDRKGNFNSRRQRYTFDIKAGGVFFNNYVGPRKKNVWGGNRMEKALSLGETARGREADMDETIP